MDGSEKVVCAKCGQPLSITTRPAGPVLCWSCSPAYEKLKEDRGERVSRTRKRIEAEIRKNDRLKGQR